MLHIILIYLNHETDMTSNYLTPWFKSIKVIFKLMLRHLIITSAYNIIIMIIKVVALSTRYWITYKFTSPLNMEDLILVNLFKEFFADGISN